MKPSWKDAPEWAKYVAQDSDGSWWWYEYKPLSDEGTWVVTKGRCDETELSPITIKQSEDSLEKKHTNEL